MIQRINGSLAVSRALGDYEYKNVEGRGPCEQLVSPEPEIFVRDRDEKDEFLVLACDGVWDVMSNEDICDFIRSRLLITDDLEAITNQVVDTCLYKVRMCNRTSLLSGGNQNSLNQCFTINRVAFILRYCVRRCDTFGVDADSCRIFE